MWNVIRRSPAPATRNLTRFRECAGLIVALSIVACQADRATAPDTEASAESTTDGRSTAESGTGAVSAVPTEGGICPACAFGPRLYTRTTGQPVTDAATFSGNPAGAYIIEIDDLGTQGANATVVLNGVALDARSGFIRKEVSLRTTNELRTRLTGKPGSKLTVSVFQEVHSVTVAPNVVYTRMPATRQFTATARDANGVVIPGQTFEWESSNANIATIGTTSGLATTRGAVYNTAAWTYETFTTGEGTAQIVARAIGSTVQGSVPWRISSGFVYTTFRAPLPLNSTRRAERPNPVALRYEVARLDRMEGRCTTERATEQWLPYALGEGLFFQCFPVIEGTTLVRRPLPFGLYLYDNVPNVGLYGRYCGAGHPGGDFVGLARGGNHEPKDPIDAMCMEHDRQFQSHELATDNLVEGVLATCIVRYGIDTETLHEDGVLVPRGSIRWLAFWLERPQMAQARLHFLAATTASCPDGNVEVGGVTILGVYNKFLSDRGLTP